MVGVAGVLLVEARRVSSDFRENLIVEVRLKDSLTAGKVPSLKEFLLSKPYVKNARYVSKEDAAKLLQKDNNLPQNYLDVLGYNPLYASFIVNLRQEFANKDSFDLIKADISKINGVEEVHIQENILETLDKNIRSASFLILVGGAALLIFAISLIFNTIRLAMFSNRFTIKTMQLFGATRWFIIRPFLGKSILNGLVGGVVACALIGALIFYFDYELPELGLKRDLITFALLSGGVILFGILISFVSTLTAVFRYLRMKVEDLY